MSTGMAVQAAAELIAGLLECIAPVRCAGCDGARTVEPEGFCAACAPLLEPAPYGLRPPAAIAAAHAYGGPLADAIARLKYGGRTDHAPALGRLLAQAALPYAGSVQAVIPMPLSARRLRERGFNQSALLARFAARALGVPLDTASLRRVRDTAAQAGLSRQERVRNVAGAFVARPIGGRVLLIDDVRTTGATLEAAGRALREARCPEVVALALAAVER